MITPNINIRKKFIKTKPRIIINPTLASMGNNKIPLRKVFSKPSVVLRVRIPLSNPGIARIIQNEYIIKFKSLIVVGSKLIKIIKNTIKPICGRKKAIISGKYKPILSFSSVIDSTP
jgi:hypothetical protein